MTEKVHQKRSSCRVCNGGRLHLFLSLGPTPLANSFLTGPDQLKQENSYPLDVYFCEDCSLVQLLDVIDPEVLFRNYIYVTGTSDLIAEHNREYAATIVDLLKLTSDNLVIEIASNDGSLLKCFQTHGVRTLGIEPATNIAEKARLRGVETVNQFFCMDTARQVRDRQGRADVVIANNVLAHVDAVKDFLAGCRHLLKPAGLVVVEVPYLGELMDRLEYDTIYHEHLCYFSLAALLRLCEEVGLSICRVDDVSVHGGSLRVYAGDKDHHPTHAELVLSRAAREREAGLVHLKRFSAFAGEVQKSKQSILELLTRIKAEGATVAGYGAPAKGNTLLNYCGIDTSLIPYTVDKNPMKVNLYTPGMHIPVLPVSTLLERQPNYVLILAWNFAEEVMRQQNEYRLRGGRFIIPLPQPRII